MGKTMIIMLETKPVKILDTIQKNRGWGKYHFKFRNSGLWSIVPKLSNITIAVCESHAKCASHYMTIDGLHVANRY